MAEPLYPIVSIYSTTSDRLPDLSIKNGQLIFVENKQKIALDYNGKRTFYNQITALKNEDERRNLSDPIEGHFYYVVDTNVLWNYQSVWIQITTPPDAIPTITEDEIMNLFH